MQIPIYNFIGNNLKVHDNIYFVHTDQVFTITDITPDTASVICEGFLQGKTWDRPTFRDVKEQEFKIEFSRYGVIPDKFILLRDV